MVAAKTHVSESKKKVVKELTELMKKKTVMIVSIKGLPAAQFQEIKKNLRAVGKIIVAKSTLVNFALEHAGIPALKDLEKNVGADCAILFSDEDAFIISGMLADSKTPAKAKAGQVPEEDIYAEAGGTDLIPGPDISALSAVGLKVKVENGKLAIQARAIVCKKGEPITPERAAILAKLNIIPFKIGIEPVAAFSNGKVYTGIKINKEEFMKDFLSMYSKALAFAVNMPFVTKETLPFVLGKAASHENALKSLIKTGDNQ
ncbi:50S ribosomal protein L10 [uncultured archaeon]|nr:50S ribosomal protein L10 [uncultured archaeon]